VRILLLGDIRPTHLKRWRSYFKDAGHDVMTVSLEEDVADRDYLHLTSSVPIQSFKYYLERNTIRRIIREFKPDIINGHFVPTYGLLAVATDFRPAAVSLWGSDILVSPRKSKLHLARALWVLRNCDIVTSDSEYMTQEALKLGKFETEIITEPMGISESEFQALSSLSRERIVDKITFLSTRRIEAIYRVDLLIEALSRVRNDLPPFNCVICGDGSERERIEDLARQHELDTVSFVGWKAGQEYLDILGGADVYVSCSRSDSTSVSLLEAMAGGLFPVVTAIPGNAEWVEDGKSALTFPDGDVDALAAALLKAAKNRVLRDDAAAMNRKTIESRAIWEKNMAAIERAFKEVVYSTR